MSDTFNQYALFSNKGEYVADVQGTEIDSINQVENILRLLLGCNKFTMTRNTDSSIIQFQYSTKTLTLVKQ